jgi:hypothetical protein
MKTKSIVIIAAIALLPLAGFAQPQPPVPPVPPVPPNPPDRHEKMPKVPVTFLGVETSEIPGVLCEQMNLPKGFGLVVDYVVPDGPAAAAGIQQNDILKMLNDQILVNPSQLRKLLQSFQDGQTVTLTLLRKGQEQKVSVKLTKKEVPKRNAMFHGRDGNWNGNFDLDFDFDENGFRFGNVDFGNLKEHLQSLKEELKEQAGENKGIIHDAVMKANEEVRRARDEARRAGREARRANGIKVIRSQDNGSLRTTKIDMGKAQIVFSDDKGEMKIETVDGKKLLTAKDPQGKLLFSGPVESKEDLDKVPADVRQRFDKLQEKDIPAVTSSDDNDEDADMNEEEESGASAEQVSNNSYPLNGWIFHVALI